jgi:hypothetical protein
MTSRAWMIRIVVSHYIPSANNYALVYYVNLFYKFFIPIVLGGMLALVGLDVGHTVYVKANKGKQSSQPPSSGAPSSSPEKSPILPPQPDQSNEEVHND